MKNIIKPQIREEVEYYSDFSGNRFDNDIPDVELKIDFGYGSRYDGAKITLHLSDEESMDILQTIKSKISEKTKKHFAKILEEQEKNYNDSMDFRDWECCDVYGNICDVYRYFLGEQSDAQ